MHNIALVSALLGWRKICVFNKEAYSELLEMSKIEYFAKIVNVLNLLTIFAKYYILYAYQSF